MIAIKATPGVWLDTDTILTSQVLDAVKKARPDIVGFMRYIPFKPSAGHDLTAWVANDISTAELSRIVDGYNYQCLLVQHPRLPGWNPGAFDGDVDGAFGAFHALTAGYPSGATLYQDIEGINGTSFDTVNYSTHVANAFASKNQAGLYVGFDVPCSSTVLYGLPHKTYWRAYGNVQDVETRSYAIRQKYPPLKIGGVEFDWNEVAPDLLGDLPVVAASSVPPAV